MLNKYSSVLAKKCKFVTTLIPMMYVYMYISIRTHIYMILVIMMLNHWSIFDLECHTCLFLFGCKVSKMGHDVSIDQSSVKHHQRVDDAQLMGS